jgi:hypothetical protein
MTGPPPPQNPPVDPALVVPSPPNPTALGSDGVSANKAVGSSIGPGMPPDVVEARKISKASDDASARETLMSTGANAYVVSDNC